MGRFTYRSPTRLRERSAVLERLFQQRGMITHLARELGLSRQAISKWKYVPEWHVKQVAKLTGVSAQRLRDPEDAP